MNPGDQVTCTRCGTTSTAYTTDPSRWKEGHALLVSWHGDRHEVAVAGVPPTVCLYCNDGTTPRPPASRRVAICNDLALHGCRADGFEWSTDQAVEDAYQRWIAAGRPRCAVVAVHPEDPKLRTCAISQLPAERQPPTATHPAAPPARPQLSLF